MTEWRLRVVFTFDPQSANYRHTLCDEFSEWHRSRGVSERLGEQLIRAGVWVASSSTGRTETFLVPPARIREVLLESREVDDVRHYAPNATGDICGAFVPAAAVAGGPCATCGHVEAQHVTRVMVPTDNYDAFVPRLSDATPGTAAGWHEREGR